MCSVKRETFKLHGNSSRHPQLVRYCVLVYIFNLAKVFGRLELCDSKFGIQQYCHCYYFVRKMCKQNGRLEDAKSKNNQLINWSRSIDRVNGTRMAKHVFRSIFIRCGWNSFRRFNGIDKIASKMIYSTPFSFWFSSQSVLLLLLFSSFSLYIGMHFICHRFCI